MAASDSAGRAVVCINGDADAVTLSRVPLTRDSLLIAVDGGITHALVLARGLQRDIDLLIGDLDSVDAATLKSVQDAGTIDIIRHPVNKDETDLELTLKHLAERAISHVTLVGVSGGRLDHQLANLLLLAASDWPFNVDFYATQGDGCLLTQHRSWRGDLSPGTIVSLVPLTSDVVGVTSSGLQYPLNNDSLPFGSPRGISNIVSSNTPTVSMSGGKMLLIVPADS